MTGREMYTDGLGQENFSGKEMPEKDPDRELLNKSRLC